MTRKSLKDGGSPSRTRRTVLSDGVRWVALAVVGGTCYRAAGAEPEPAAVVSALEPLSVRGINYYPALTPWGGLWTKTPAEVIERDMAMMASLHVNTVRTFVPCSAGTRAAKLTDADGNVSPAYLAKIEQFLAVAWQRGIRTIFCFDFDDKMLAQSDGAVWRAAARDIVAKFRADGRVLMWDLMNEPEGHRWSAASRAYLKSATPYVKELDDRHLTTVGIGWEIERLAELGLPNVLQYHEYAPKQELFEQGIDRVGKTISRMRKLGGDRQLIIGEFGMSTARDPDHGAGASWQSRLPAAPGTEEEQSRLYGIVLDAAEHFRVAGVMPWCLHSYPTAQQGFLTPAESMFGLVRHDGTLKRAAEQLKERYARWAQREAK